MPRLTHLLVPWAALAALTPVSAPAADFTAVIHLAADGAMSVRLPGGEVAGTAEGDEDFLLDLEPGDRVSWRVVADPGCEDAWRIGITDIADFWGVIGRWGMRPRRDSRLATPYHVAPVWPAGPSGETQYLQTSDRSLPPAEMNFRIYCWPADLDDAAPVRSVRGYVSLTDPDERAAGS